MDGARLVSILFLSGYLLNGCGGGSSTPATHLSVTVASATATAGTPFNITVSALDASGAVLPTYPGTVHFTSSDAQAVLPANSTLTNGKGAFSVTLKTAGSQTMTATDMVNSSITGTSSTISVSPVAGPTHFSVTAPASATVGMAFNFTVTALDASNHTVTSYSGTVHFTSTDNQAVLPADATLMNGVGNFSATLKSLGGQTITATDTVAASITGTSNSISVIDPATHFSLSAPAAVTTGTSFSFTVTALDASNNVATGYSGTVHFSSTDSQAALPSSQMLANGMGTFSATLKTIGKKTITATDTVTATVTGTSNSINVVSATATHFSLTATSSARVGTSFTLGVSALDAANNVAATYAGSVHFTSSDPIAVLPADATLSGGKGNFNATLNTIGSQTITATDTVTRSINGTSNAIAVFTGTCQGVGMPCYQGHYCCPGLKCVFAGDRAKCEAISAAEPFAIASRFTFTCVLETARESHTATLLNTGIVLIAGGDEGSTSLAKAELFNPDTHTFAPAGEMASARTLHTATLLQNSAVLLIGGRDSEGRALSTSELFDPTIIHFAPLSSMTSPRESHSATLLRNGKVLVSGGDDGIAALATAELFDPATGKFSQVGSMGSPRTYHTATLLKDGKVLVAGGRDDHGRALSSTELFDPATGRFSPVGNMQSPREFHTATLLPDGKVLIAGGENEGATLSTGEFFDPATKKFTPVGNMSSARELHTATLRKDGTVLLVGGAEVTEESRQDTLVPALPRFLLTAELFDPLTGKFTPTSSMSNPRAKHTATLLPNGEVLVIGGTLSEDFDGRDFLASAELFQ